MKLYDVVALKEDQPQENLVAGQVGTLVDELEPGVFLVEFSDDDGATYAMPTLKTEQLLPLKYARVA